MSVSRVPRRKSASGRQRSEAPRAPRGRQARAAFIARRLDAFCPQPDIPLRHRDSFTLLISVLLSAQCTDARVNQVTPGLFALAATPQTMARLSVRQIERQIRSCGLAPQKARAIRRLSQILVARYGGQVPATFDALESLPGVGHKTASVMMVQAFGVPAFPVDTHIHRLARRWGLSRGDNVVQTERDLKRLFPPQVWGRVHLQMIDYGRRACTARGCDGTVCDICRSCFPQRKKPVSRRPA